MTAGNWVHTEPNPMGDRGVYPLAPWAAHPEVDLDRELLAELLSTLRDDVIGWADIAHKSSSDYAEHRAQAAQESLKLVERIVRRSAHRARLRREAGL